MCKLENLFHFYNLSSKQFMDRSSNSNSYSHSRHHYDSYESSSIVSMPTDTESESDSSEKNTSIAKAPVMVSRSYLFEGAPIYISDFFVKK